MNRDSLPYTVRLEVYRKGRWELVDDGTEMRAEPSSPPPFWKGPRSRR
jgi:hypothetical protein